jgi:uncharacterized protein with NAD-binding domain and iron-sulfur cluster
MSSVLVIGAGLSGLAASEVLLDAGLSVTIIDAFPVPGGRVASFDVKSEVAGLVPGDVVEHGLHGWFQHYHALFALMQRAGLSKPRFAGKGVHFWYPDHGHFTIPGGQVAWLVHALRLPESLRGSRTQALAAFGRLIGQLDAALANPELTDRDSAATLLARFGVPEQAIRTIFRPCMFSLTSLPLEQLSALELLRWLSKILPDPRIRCLDGGGTAAMCGPIAAYLEERGADLRLGVEVHSLALDERGRARLELAQAPDRTGLRHILVPGFQPAAVPEAAFDAVISTLPPDRLLAVSSDSTRSHPVFRQIAELRPVHPLSVRIWFERALRSTGTDYVLSSGTVFDVLRPTPEPARYTDIHLLDVLVDNIETHLPELPYTSEQYLTGALEARVLERLLTDLERVYPGEIRGNRVSRRFLHTREGIIAVRPGTWSKRPPQYIGSGSFFLAGDFTQHAHGVCMEGAVRSGQLAARCLLAGRQVKDTTGAFDQLTRSVRSLWDDFPTTWLTRPLRRRAGLPRADSPPPGSAPDESS